MGFKIYSALIGTAAGDGYASALNVNRVGHRFICLSTTQARSGPSGDREQRQAPSSNAGLRELHRKPLAPLLGGPAGPLVDDGFGARALPALFHGEPLGLRDRVGQIAVRRGQLAGVLHAVEPARGPPEPLEIVARSPAAFGLDLAPGQATTVALLSRSERRRWSLIARARKSATTSSTSSPLIAARRSGRRRPTAARPTRREE